MMHSFRKNGLKVKIPIKLIGKDLFLSLLWTDHTEYEEYQKKFMSQLSTVIFKIPAQ